MNEMQRKQQNVLLEACQLVKAYTLGAYKIEVLRGVDLRIFPGDFIALRGASGAGKSTLLHLLAGLDLPTSGQVLWRGTPLTQLGSGSLARFRNRHVGFIFQAYHLFPELDALENVMLPARIARQPYRAARERAEALLVRVGLGDRLRHRPVELSGGEQQRVAIARALINDPELVLADEPTGNLDSRTGHEILELLCEVQRESGMALIIATHDSRVAAYAPIIVELRDGQIVNSHTYLEQASVDRASTNL